MPDKQPWPKPTEPTPTRKIAAIALLDEQELRNVTMSIKRLYPIADDGSFDDLLIAIERATRKR